MYKPRKDSSSVPLAVPSRKQLLPLDRYAHIEQDGVAYPAGYVEGKAVGVNISVSTAPIPPVYEGKFSVVPKEVVLEDIRAQVEAGAATHITFGDPDFLNGPTHALRIIQAMHAVFPNLTFDCTNQN